MGWFNKIADYESDFSGQIQDIAKRNPYPFKEWFDENGRVYLPFGVQNNEEGVDKYVKMTLEENGYVITDYRKGLCSKDNRVFRIGRILNQIKSIEAKKLQEAYQRGEIYNLDRELQESSKYMDETINTFTNSSYRTQKSFNDFYVVVSQNPHDVAQMSTGRNWTSCMNLGGEGVDQGSHHEDIYCEVASGGLVAYLVNKEDLEIRNPIARIHIRRFDNRDGKSVAMPERSVYGQDVSGFYDFVLNWLNSKQTISPGMYSRQGGSYSDTFGTKGDQLFSPSKTEDVLAWLRGTANDSVYYEYIVSDELYDDYKDYSQEEIGRGYNEWDPDFQQSSIENLTEKFKTMEEAEEYWNLVNKDDYHYDRQIMEDDYGLNSWTSTNEEEEYDRDRFKIKTKKFDHTHSMRSEAIRSILSAEKGTYPVEVLNEIKQEALKQTGLSRDFYKKYPELITDEDLRNMDDMNSIEFITSLPPEQKEEKTKGWTEYILRTLNNPHNITDIDLEENLLPALQQYEKQYSQMSEGSRNNDGFIAKWNRAAQKVTDKIRQNFRDYITYPAKELYSPIPEEIIQKMVEYPSKITDTFFNHPFYKQQGIDTDLYLNLASHNVHALEQTGSDTPSVQRFYESLLPYWDDRPNAEFRSRDPNVGLHDLGFAIGKLGHNGQQFIPFIKEKLEQTQREKEGIKKEMEELSPGSFTWTQKKTLIERLDKLVERHLYILDLLESGQSYSGKYRWARHYNWYKKAIYGV
jgi:hypothetical protein